MKVVSMCVSLSTVLGRIICGCVYLEHVKMKIRGF